MKKRALSLFGIKTSPKGEEQNEQREKKPLTRSPNSVNEGKQEEQENKEDKASLARTNSIFGIKLNRKKNASLVEAEELKKILDLHQQIDANMTAFASMSVKTMDLLNWLSTNSNMLLAFKDVIENRKMEENITYLEDFRSYANANDEMKKKLGLKLYEDYIAKEKVNITDDSLKITLDKLAENKELHTPEAKTAFENVAEHIQYYFRQDVAIQKIGLIEEIKKALKNAVDNPKLKHHNSFTALRRG